MKKMSKWKKQSLKSVLELVTVGTVILSLIFVMLELRQNTEASQSATLQSMISASQDHLLLLASDPELNRIYRQGMSAPNSLNEADKSRFFFLLRAQWLRFQNAYLQWQAGTMSNEGWSFYESYLCAQSTSTTDNTRRLAWTEHKSALTPQFIQYVEACREAPRG